MIAAKKHYKKTITRTLLDKARDFFVKNYPENDTRSAYIRNYKKFIDFCREKHSCKTPEECADHIGDYLEYLKEKYTSPNTIRTYFSPVVVYHEDTFDNYDMPKRCAANNTRSRKERAEYRPNSDPDNPKYEKSVSLQRCIGIRRNELLKLRKNDFTYDESGHFCVVIRRGKGGKYQEQRILPEDVEFVKSFFDGTDDYVISREEMKNKIDYHPIRAEHARKTYFYYLDKVNNNPEYRKTLEKEIIARWNRLNLDKNGKPKRFDKSQITGVHQLEKEEYVELAQKINMPLEYDNLVAMYTSIFSLSHWRLDVTFYNYLLAVKSK